jgi:hypothetical protein
MKSTTAFACLLASPGWLAPAALAAGPLRAGAAEQIVAPDLRSYSPVYIAGYGDIRVVGGKD